MSSCCQNKCDSRATKARCVHHHQHLDFRGPADNERVPGELGGSGDEQLGSLQHVWIVFWQH